MWALYYKCEVIMRKKRAITLLEIMIVILLIGIVGGVVSYNLKGTLDRGKAFRSEIGAKKLEDILNLEIQTGFIHAKQLCGKKTENRDNLINTLRNSGLIPEREISAFILDGWKDPFIIRKIKGQNAVYVTSERLNQYVLDHGGEHLSKEEFVVETDSD